MNVKSNIEVINASAGQIFDYISNFNNFGKLLPDQVKNWQSTEDTCYFEIQGMAKIALRTKEITKPTRFVISSEAPTPFDLQLSVILDPTSENTCKSLVELDANLNPMVAMMAKNPLQNFVNILNQKIKEKFV